MENLIKLESPIFFLIVYYSCKGIVFFDTKDEISLIFFNKIAQHVQRLVSYSDTVVAGLEHLAFHLS